MDFSYLLGNRTTLSAVKSAGPADGELRQVRDYWDSLRQNGLPPQRSAIDPRALPGALDRVFLAERIGRGLAQFRIAGSVLSELAGVETRNLPVSCLFTPDARLRLAVAIERVFVEPVIAELHLMAETGIGRPALEARLLMLPLRDGDGELSLILGCLVLQGGIGRAPRRFAVTRGLEERLLVPHPKATTAELAAFAAFAEPVAVFSGAEKAQKAHGHLRLVYSAPA